MISSGYNNYTGISGVNKPSGTTTVPSISTALSNVTITQRINGTNISSLNDTTISNIGSTSSLCPSGYQYNSFNNLC
jgi:hypothetical protein